MENLKFISNGRGKVAPTCPCGKPNRTKFAPVKGNPNVGKCFSCGKFFNDGSINPKDFKFPEEGQFKTVKIQDAEPTMKAFNRSAFYRFCKRKFGQELTDEAFKRYRIGGTKLDAVAFWQIDDKNRIRTAQLMHYSEHLGKKVPPYGRWAHNELEYLKKSYKQCLFGLHLTIDDERAIGIVEGAKTALICSMYYPRFIWLSTNGECGLNESNLKPLQGRKIVLFPDKGFSDSWRDKIVEVSKSLKDIDCKISDFMERQNDFGRNADLADYIISKIDQKDKRESETNLFDWEKVSASIRPILETMVKENPTIQSFLDLMDIDPEAIKIDPILCSK